jgi:hypothetical protein
MEGIGLNAAARVFGYAKTTILNWEKKLSGLQLDSGKFMDAR